MGLRITSKSIRHSASRWGTWKWSRRSPSADAKGILSDSELDTTLSDIDAQREKSAAEFRHS